MLLVCFCRHKRQVLSQGSYLIIVCVRAGVLPHAHVYTVIAYIYNISYVMTFYGVWVWVCACLGF